MSPGSRIQPVVADFISNFVAMATRAGLFKILLTSLDSLIAKNPCQSQASRRYILYKLSYSRFCLKFRCHGNGGRLWQHLSGIIQQPAPENPLLHPTISQISCIQTELQTILSQISLPWQRGFVAVEFVWRHSIARPRQPPVIHKDLADISYVSRVISDFVR